MIVLCRPDRSESRQKGRSLWIILSHNIAVNLKRIRTSKGMSLDVVAEQTGVSKSMLAQIERGTANPSIGVLGKIVSGLRLDFNELIQTPPLDSYLGHGRRRHRRSRRCRDSIGCGTVFRSRIIIWSRSTGSILNRTAFTPAEAMASGRGSILRSWRGSLPWN